jgi:hypothetical protein
MPAASLLEDSAQNQRLVQQARGLASRADGQTSGAPFPLDFLLEGAGGEPVDVDSFASSSVVWSAELPGLGRGVGAVVAANAAANFALVGTGVGGGAGVGVNERLMRLPEAGSGPVKERPPPLV